MALRIPSHFRSGGRTRRGPRLIALSTASALCAALLVGAPPPASATPTEPPAAGAESTAPADSAPQGEASEPAPAGPRPVAPKVAPDEAAAADLARRTGESVEMADRRTETEQLFAEPDGSRRLVVTALPTRVRQAKGWVDVNPVLTRRPDGTVAPVAAAADVTFSGGGDAPLVRVAKNGAALAYTWPAPLPAPVLDGRTATYPEVFPGVDLKLSADAHGFSQVLVVKNAAAAADPRLAELRLGVRTEGGDLVLDEDGNLTLISATGDVAFHGSTPRMWDSAGSADEDGDRLAGPRTGDRVGEIGVRRDGDALVLTPDTAYLRDPERVFPVHIDPPMHAAGRLAFAYVSKHFKTTKYYGTSDVAKVGYYNDPKASPTQDTYRSFFRMNTSAVNGKHIISATFRTFETHSWSCTARSVQLWLTGGIGTGTTWNNQPSWSRQISAKNVAKGYNSSCPDGGVDFDAKSAVEEAASKKWSNLTLGLRAASESDKLGWKKFRNNPVLEITYNTTPNVPDQLSTDVGASAGVACKTGADAPYVTTRTPTLRARVSDPDSGKGQTVRAHFEWYVAGGAKVGERYTSYVASGTPVTAPIPSGAFNDGVRYSWRVRAQDGVSGSGNSGWSAWCDLIVDLSRPSSPPTVASADYPATPEGGDPVPSGGVGRMGTFTLSPGPGDDDIAGFHYALNQDDFGAAAYVAAGADGTAQVRLTPPRSLLNVLYVWSRDKAGHVGPYRRHEFSVGPATGPVGHWRMDETSGDQAADSSGNGHHAVLSDGARFVPGRAGGAVNFPAAGAQVALRTAAPVIHTDQNFTVAAWVRLTDKSDYRTILSQDSGNRSSFYLQYHKGHDRWSLTLWTADDKTGAYAVSNAPPQLGVWTHLAGTFDAATGKMRLYVNGREQSTVATQTQPWRGTGTFTIGRAWNRQNLWVGDADDARAYDRVLYPAEISDLANRPPLLEGHWRFDETSGTQVTDSSGANRHGTANAGVTFTGDGWIGGAGRFASGGNVVTSGPVLRTDTGFTVAAWVRLADKNATRTVLSQDGANRSGFSLQYDKSTDRWAMVRFSTDAASGGTQYTAQSRDPATAGEWTHLAATYDPGTGLLRLFVNGNLEGTATDPVGWSAGGRFAIGRAFGTTNPFAGDVDDVRAYSGVLTEDEIFDLALQ